MNIRSEKLRDIAFEGNFGLEREALRNSSMARLDEMGANDMNELNASDLTVHKIRDSVLSGREVSRSEALWLLREADRAGLYDASHEITAAMASSEFDFCAIISARLGRCTEDCKWCAQSAHWRTGCKAHGWVGTDACVAAAKAAERDGARRIGIVTSGRGQTDAEIDKVSEAIRAMRHKTDIGLCASLGLVTEDQLKRLKAAGLERLHCNIETAPSKFPRLCSTHASGDKLATLQAARRVGLQICCGGIIGMGETDDELVEFAFALREIAPDSIPVNILHPIPGTPLGHRRRLGIRRILDSIAIIRFVNPRPSLRFAGGRSDLSDDDARMCIYVGINAGIAGSLLTTSGADYSDDRVLAIEAGYAV